jgi:hypothetical protein
MKQQLIFLAFLLPSMAFAGPAERKLLNDDVMPSIKKAQEAYKTNCGCSLEMTVDKGITTKDGLLAARRLAEEIAGGAAKACSDKEAKGLLCKMNSLNFESRAKKKTEFTLNGSKGSAGFDGSSRTDWEMIVKVLDK